MAFAGTYDLLAPFVLGTQLTKAIVTGTCVVVDIQRLLRIVVIKVNTPRLLLNACCISDASSGRHASYYVHHVGCAIQNDVNNECTQ
jgi:hypothetical protein